MLVDLETEDARHAIGGGIWVAEIKRHAVTTSRIHSWPDQVGQRVDPRPTWGELPIIAPSWIPEARKAEWIRLYKAGRIGADLKFPAAPPPQLPPQMPAGALNRADRRRLEKLQRKSGRKS